MTTSTGGKIDLAFLPLEYGITESHQQRPCLGCGMVAKSGAFFCLPCKKEPRRHGRAWKRRARSALELVCRPSIEDIQDVGGIEALWYMKVHPALWRWLYENVLRDYGIDDTPEVREVFYGAPLEAMASQLAPSAATVRDTMITCSCCGEKNPEMEPVSKPEYRYALDLAIAREAMSGSVTAAAIPVA